MQNRFFYELIWVDSNQSLESIACFWAFSASHLEGLGLGLLRCSTIFLLGRAPMFPAANIRFERLKHPTAYLLFVRNLPGPPIRHPPPIYPSILLPTYLPVYQLIPCFRIHHCISIRFYKYTIMQPQGPKLFLAFLGYKYEYYIPIGSMYAIYDNIYHQYTPNVSIYTIHGSYGIVLLCHPFFDVRARPVVLWPSRVSASHRSSPRWTPSGLTGCTSNGRHKLEQRTQGSGKNMRPMPTRTTKSIQKSQTMLFVEGLLLFFLLAISS